MVVEKHALEVVNCWKYTKGRMYTDIRHYLKGLPRGTVVSSADGSRKWQIAGRIFFSHIAPEQTELEGEYPERLFLKFTSAEKREQSRQRILRNESARVFVYSLDCIDHDEPMLKGETYYTEILTD